MVSSRQLLSRPSHPLDALAVLDAAEARFLWREIFEDESYARGFERLRAAGALSVWVGGLCMP